ncbi:MAG: COQ9 family protein [Alphaproteobacteria bacterium]|nr:COQ9 family protein [Alphaproteobacteria bacterium]
MLLDSPETKQKILDEFLPLCAFDGWSKEALVKAAEKCGIGENFLPLIFENGLLDLAEFYLESQNEKSAAISESIEGRKIRDKIRLSLYARFKVEQQNKIAIQRLINFYLDPKNFTSFETGVRPAIHGLSACYKIADFIWKNINDQSTDFNYYTKRITLGKIIFRAVPIFLKDEIRVENFIDTEIEKVMRFEKLKSGVKKTFCEFFWDENGELKSPKQIIKNFPFFRLM